MMVHVYGKPRMVEGKELYSLLSSLLEKHEVNTGYNFENLSADFVEREMRGVAGFAIEVTRIEAAYKLSQNRDGESQANIVRELEKRGDENSAQVTGEMRQIRAG